MEYVTLGVVILVLGLQILSYLKKDEKEENKLHNLMREESVKTLTTLTKEFAELRVEITKSMGENSKENIKDLNGFKESLKSNIETNFEKMNLKIETQMDQINNKVENRLNEGFEKTNKTFNNIVERLTRIDEAQKNIDKLSTEVVSLQHLLTDKKTRGTFGEVQLNQILGNVFGENNKRIYETQHKLSNSKMVDAVLHLTPEMGGKLCIDSKFPLENYQRMVDRELTQRDRELATRAFKSDMKKHIDAIASKYIIPNETSEQAVLFVPAEAIFAEINAYHQDIVEYAQRRKVWIASPTTLMSLLTTVQVMMNNAERAKNARIIKEELEILGREFGRYQDRWAGLSRSIETLSKKANEVNITSGKISKRFEMISQVEFEDDLEKIE